MNFSHREYLTKAYLGEITIEGMAYIRYSRNHMLPIPLESLLEEADQNWRSFWRNEVRYIDNEVLMPRKSSFGDFPSFFPISLPDSFVSRWFAAHKKQYHFGPRAGALDRACISNPCLFGLFIEYRVSAAAA